MPRETVQANPDSKQAVPPSSRMEVDVHALPALQQDPGEECGIDLSHQLRTTLGVITLLSGNLDLLYDRLSEPQRRKLIRDLREHTRKMNDFIGDVLDLCDYAGVATM
jgi:hypothetical protein